MQQTFLCRRLGWHWSRHDDENYRRTQLWCAALVLSRHLWWCTAGDGAGNRRRSTCRLHISMQIYSLFIGTSDRRRPNTHRLSASVFGCLTKVPRTEAPTRIFLLYIFKVEYRYIQLAYRQFHFIDTMHFNTSVFVAICTQTELKYQVSKFIEIL